MKYIKSRNADVFTDLVKAEVVWSQRVFRAFSYLLSRELARVWRDNERNDQKNLKDDLH